MNWKQFDGPHEQFSFKFRGHSLSMYLWRQPEGVGWGVYDEDADRWVVYPTTDAENDDTVRETAESWYSNLRRTKPHLSKLYDDA